MQKKRCFFIGHREVSHEVYPLLYDAVETHITKYNTTEFIVGHYGQFDALAARAVIAAKKAYPYISLLLLLPYHPSEQPIAISPDFDGTLYPEGMEKVPRRFAIVRANRYMAEHTDHIIAYARHTASNASTLVQYAKSRNVPICNLADSHSPS